MAVNWLTLARDPSILADMLNHSFVRRASFFLSVVFLISAIARVGLFWKTEIANQVLVGALVLGLCAALIVGRKRQITIHMLPTLYGFAVLELVNTARVLWPSLLPQKQLIGMLLGTTESAGMLSFLGVTALVLGVSYTLSDVFMQVCTGATPRRWLTVFQRRPFFFALLFSFVLTSVYSIDLALRHAAFTATVYDFGIFDQALYMLSRGATGSTTRQFTNIFFDHQHFSLVLLTPLYWIGRGLHGYTLQILTPFLLIFFPSVVTFYIAQTFAALRGLDIKKPYWVIPTTSLLLWLHPYTQSAIGFYFHEKYLMPLVFTGFLYTVVSFVHAPTWRWFAGMCTFALLWSGIKEDQWLFVFVCVLQCGVATWLHAGVRSAVNRFRVLGVSAVAVVPLVYAGFLSWFHTQSTNGQYVHLYSHLGLAARQCFVELNPAAALQTLKLMDDVNIYQYQHLLTLDLFGVIVFPLSVLGNYAERLLAESPSLKNPIFHYGVDVPIYSAVGFVLLLLLLQKHLPALSRRVHFFGITLALVGFSALLGWNAIYYLVPTMQRDVVRFVETRSERVSVAETARRIPADASLVVSDGWATHFTARTSVAQWPEVLQLPEGTPGKNALATFDYWLLRRSDATTAAQVQLLVDSGYQIIEETEFAFLVQR